MINEIYKAFRNSGFTSKGQDIKNNERMNIRRTFTKDNFYAEIYNEDYGFSIFIYGGIFMNGYFPFIIDITEKSDIDFLIKKLES